MSYTWVQTCMSSRELKLIMAHFHKTITKMEPTRKEEKKVGDQVTMETKRTESEMGKMNYN